MVEIPRKKSPRAPSYALDEALDRVLKAYERERLHPTPTDVFAQNIGYKSASSGSALTAIASLRYYGLVDRPSDGVLVITKAVESYKYAPSEDQKRALLTGFLKSPPLFADLLEKFASGLPSDANLKYELINRGFIPQAAETVLNAFRRSVNFVDYFGQPSGQVFSDSEEEAEDQPAVLISSQPKPVALIQPATLTSSPSVDLTVDEGLDRIPVRLQGGRRAWLVIPTPFFSADKKRLKAQIDLLLTEDEESDLA